MRAVLAIVVGIVVAFAAQTAADIVNNLLYPPPVADMFDLEQVTRAMATRPAPALLLGALAYLIGALAGGVVGKLIWRHKAAAWTPAVVLALMALIIAFNLPMPGWAMFATFVAPLLGGLIANHLVKGAPAVPTEAEPEA